MREVMIASGCRTAIGTFGGALRVVTLLRGMRRLARRRGLATLCIGGGQGIAMIVEHEP